MKHSKRIAFVLLALVVSVLAGPPMQLAITDFTAANDNAAKLTTVLSQTTEELKGRLGNRADVQLVPDSQQGACRLAGTIQDLTMRTTTFRGSTYQAWNSRVSVSMRLILQNPGGEPLRRDFTVVRRLRSTAGEPKLDRELCLQLSHDLAARCYEELVDMVQTLN